MQLFGTQDQSAVGVELVQVKENRNLDKHSRSNINGNPLTKYPNCTHPSLIEGIHYLSEVLIK